MSLECLAEDEVVKMKGLQASCFLAQRLGWAARDSEGP